MCAWHTAGTCYIVTEWMSYLLLGHDEECKVLLFSLFLKSGEGKWIVCLNTARLYRDFLFCVGEKISDFICFVDFKIGIML